MSYVICLVDVVCLFISLVNNTPKPDDEANLVLPKVVIGYSVITNHIVFNLPKWSEMIFTCAINKKDGSVIR